MSRTVIHYTDSDGFGGAEQVVLQLLGGLDRQRWQPMLLHHGGASSERLARRAGEIGVALRRVPWVARLRQLPRGLFPLVRAIRAERPAVFHAHLPAPMSGKYGLLAAALAGVPATVATVHLYTDVRPGWRADLGQRVAQARVGRYIAVSEEVARRMRGRFRLTASRVTIIRNGIDLALFDRPADPDLRRWLEGQPPRPVALTVARLDPQKGLDHLLAAAAAVPGAVFVVAGEGPERPRLERLAQELGVADRVRFLGHRSDVADLLAACDVFVLPSLFEGLPLSVLEAMAAGKPVIATCVGGTDEAVIDGESGLLVPPADSSALAAAIRKVLGDPRVAGRLGQGGQARVRREFDARRMVAEVSALYDELLGVAGSHGARG